MTKSRDEVFKIAWDAVHACPVINDEGRNEFIGRSNSTKAAWISTVIEGLITAGVIVQWRPIEEYDKERGFEPDGWVLLGWWSNALGGGKEWLQCTGQWNGSDFVNGFSAMPATHFMPLPTPPQAGENK